MSNFTIFKNPDSNISYTIRYKNNLLGTLVLDKTLTLEIKDVTYLHFRKQKLIIENNKFVNEREIDRFLSKITYNTSILKEFINQCPFIVFDDFNSFINLLKEFVNLKATETSKIVYVAYMNVLLYA